MKTQWIWFCFLGLFCVFWLFFCLLLSLDHCLCVLFTTGILSRSLSSSSSSLDSPHGPSTRPRPLPRQRLPARARRHRVLLSPRGTPSPALHPPPDTAALSTARLCHYNFSGLIIDLIMTASISGISWLYSSNEQKLRPVIVTVVKQLYYLSQMLEAEPRQRVALCVGPPSCVWGRGCWW